VRPGCVVLTYNSMDYLYMIEDQCGLLFYKTLFIYNEHPWNGERAYKDDTLKYLIGLCARDPTRFSFILGNGDEFATESGCRNMGVKYLKTIYDCDIVFQIDDDELYSDGALQYIQEYIDKHDADVYCLDGGSIRTLWGDRNHEVWPRYEHVPVIATKPHVMFDQARCVVPGYSREVIKLPVSMHMDHWSWIHKEEVVRAKLSAYSHAGDVPDGWIENVWAARAKSSSEGPAKFESVKEVER